MGAITGTVNATKSRRSTPPLPIARRARASSRDPGDRNRRVHATHATPARVHHSPARRRNAATKGRGSTGTARPGRVTEGYTLPRQAGNRDRSARGYARTWKTEDAPIRHREETPSRAHTPRPRGPAERFTKPRCRGGSRGGDDEENVMVAREHHVRKARLVWRYRSSSRVQPLCFVVNATPACCSPSRS